MIKIPSNKSNAVSSIAKAKAPKKSTPPSTSSAKTPIEDNITIAGIPSAELTPKVQATLQSLVQEVNELRAELADVRQQLAEAELRADHDGFLEISNRRAFVRDLSRALALAERYNNIASLIFIDLNNLKNINDTYGHKAGDLALKHVAKIIQSQIRGGDSFGRLGGDEFGLILINADKDAATNKANYIAQSIKNHPLSWQKEMLQLSIAFGVIGITPGQSVEHALELADQAMYRHKRGEEKYD